MPRELRKKRKEFIVRGIVAGMGLAAATTLITAVPAHAAAPKNPIAVVKKQMAAGKGVTFVERVTLIEGQKRKILLRRSGTYQLNASGIAASDITSSFGVKASDLGLHADPAMGLTVNEPERSITIGKSIYLSGSVWDSLIPKGETWYKTSQPWPGGFFPYVLHGGFAGLYGQPMNVVVEPAALKKLLRNASPVPGGYVGTITVGWLYATSPSFKARLRGERPSPEVSKNIVRWKLTVDSKGLPTRMVSTMPARFFGVSNTKDAVLRFDTRYNAWSATFSITPP
ncbi:hypothetical protein [Nonomuraea sp. NPDC049709]|uniref:hypothetical protein n=1 Tax=Nonomuraea sp. NPDC049709 TaxID=3154736 RepID=UPI003426DE7B